MMRVTLRRGPYSWLVNGEIHGVWNRGNYYKNFYYMGQLIGEKRQGMRKTYCINGFYIGHQIFVAKEFGSAVLKTFSGPRITSGISYHLI